MGRSKCPFRTISIHDVTRLNKQQFDFLVAAADTDGKNRSIARKLKIPLQDAIDIRESIMTDLRLEKSIEIIMAGQLAIQTISGVTLPLEKVS